MERATAWEKKKLANVATSQKDGSVTGKGKFNFSSTLDMGIAVKQEFIVEFMGTVMAQEKTYKYTITDIQIIQNPSALTTTVSLEEFVNQYKNQGVLNENIVSHVNNILQTIDKEIKGYISDLKQSM